MSSTQAVLRVERGRATDAELAAVTVVLFSVLAARGEDAGEEQTPDVPPWRPERAPAAYRSPYSWQ
ncbi:acyl-CoA carboxylase subunit epsilon [Streptomyces caniscabiei]|uniref:Acyl-CoA carboxylase subunit epsilon n=1 Tax=Streptomyces caniscabiei TaxID=2746961 RepID=A0A927LHY6_9ACTN|nr:acyl-CoA carboxylase subunit epsilon [Streptomyces caniscabiei]MBD9704640.1 acyl-CoA carboxylase subunit epsilon [Streptomyces caniscabiei]MBD9729368.1 acyl-CoA carboxylase subunit epsilon [Streptomyces caniscabiei]MDX3515034.1 acyl-CoA carboxylase subunit epsilon [Streptomyces caniscabiei]MDX3724346.1 acyl-CoA carboxylase subunit epsilon [Streptomyces caniscabiei]MDX3733771.1 acyl-CoA carboxylase subunit epsilon [Streptomyces caniscabiei]